MEDTYMNKTMIRLLMRSIGVLASALLLLVACQQDELGIDSQPVKDGYVSIHFNTNVPAMEVVQTRAVDLDGGGVQNMTLFCFDQYGLFITTASADLKSSSPTSGTFEAQVPEHTRRIHFVANQVLTDFAQDEFRNKSESEVMALLEGSSGRMIYWARFACKADNKENIAKQLEAAENKVTLLRNHAKVSVNNPETNEHFTVTGFAVYNTNAFGTVAPYHPDKGFNFTMDDWKKDDFITLPANVTKLSDVTDVTDVNGRYIFECENGADDPVSVILRGRNNDNNGSNEELYYRIMLVDENGEQIRLRRNHDYQINIVGPLSFGQPTFAAAVEAAATNNVWISISDNVNEVEDAHYILKVDQTNYVIDDTQVTAGNVYTLLYSIKGKNDQTIDATNDKAEVKWLDNYVARQDIGHDFTVDSNGEGKGQIRISFLPLGNNEKLEGTLLVKHGRLQRKIKVILVKKQSFVPSWVGTQVYGGMNQSDPTQKRSHVTVMFTVPETCPAELFPMKVYLSVGGLDIRAASGMNLTVVREGDTDWYSSGTIKPEPEYKYLYVVEEPGVQRVYFENILSQADGYIGTLNIEAEHFKTMDRNFTYSNNKKSITVTGLKAYNATGGGIEGVADDELVLYRLVPQKKHALVQFDLQLREKTGDDLADDLQGTPFNAEEKDEFLLYSQFLDFFTDEEVDQVGGVDVFDCMFHPGEAETWWKQYNPNAGRMLMFQPREPNKPSGKTGQYSIYLKTNRPKSAEVIRIASNYETQKPVLTTNAGTDGKYGGNSYRSVTFELANYNPFRFGARAMYGGTTYGKEPDRKSNPTADVPELITPMEWTYEPGKPVEIAFDVTSFRGSDGKSVDPFGERFTIFIDAPMLELGTNTGLGNKLKEVSPGRFAYTVDADREAERKHFTGSTVVNTDPTAGVNQAGERKTLHFKVKDIVSAGDIRISSDQSQVVFYTKTFTVTNTPIKGTIHYLNNQPVPNGAFVAFERESDRSRIGAITVNANGQYELRLRKEYVFNWHTDPIVFHYDAGNGITYTCRVANLATLFSNPNVVLTNKP